MLNFKEVYSLFFPEQLIEGKCKFRYIYIYFTNQQISFGFWWEDAIITKLRICGSKYNTFFLKKRKKKKNYLFWFYDIYSLSTQLDWKSFVYFEIICFHQLWYSLSKTLGEAAAWKFAKENAIDMVTINPGFVIGPLLQPTLNTSVEPILKLVNGTLQL